MTPPRPTLRDCLDMHFGQHYARAHSPRVVLSNKTGWRRAVIRVALWLAAKARAILSGATHGMPEHIKAVALPVLRHRIITNFNAEADGVTADDIVDRLLEATPIESNDGVTEQQMDMVMN